VASGELYSEREDKRYAASSAVENLLSGSREERKLSLGEEHKFIEGRALG